MNKNHWDDIFKNSENTKTDSWLSEFIGKKSDAEKNVCLDIGCGSGSDSLFLSETGFEVVVVDISKNALFQNCSLNKIQINLENLLPFRQNSFDLINASLSLHYFDLNLTQKIIDDVFNILKLKGKFYGRFNSVKDIKNIPGKIAEVSENYFQTEQGFKTFFDEKILKRIFRKWEIQFIQEKEADYFGNNKVFWELVAGKEY